MKRVQRSWLILALVLATFGSVSLGAADPVELKVGEEYDILLEDGEEFARAMVMETSPDQVVVEMRGLSKSIRIPRSAIRAALLLEKRQLIRRIDLGLWGGFQASLADLRLLAPYFPGGAIAMNAELGKKVPLVRFHAINMELDLAYVSDGERRIWAGGFTISPRWYLKLFGIDWFAGLGGGLSGLYLKSYTFQKWSYVPLTFLETGAFRDLGNHVRIYFSVRGNYYLDIGAPLASVGLRLGLSYRL